MYNQLCTVTDAHWSSLPTHLNIQIAGYTQGAQDTGQFYTGTLYEFKVI